MDNIMSTRAHIGTMQDDELVYIYLHFDGYPSHALETLKEHYNTQEKVDELISMGDMSVLAVNIETSIFYARDRHEEKLIHFGERNFLNGGVSYSYIFKDGEWKVYG